MTTREIPQIVACDDTVAADAAWGLRWLVMVLVLHGALDATVIILSVVPRALLTDDSLSLFRRMTNAFKEGEAVFKGPTAFAASF